MVNLRLSYMNNPEDSGYVVTQQIYGGKRNNCIYGYYDSFI